MKRVRILNTHFEGGKPKFVAGRTYPLTAETWRMVVLSHAEPAADDDEVGAEVESAPPADLKGGEDAGRVADQPQQAEKPAADAAVPTPKGRRSASRANAQA